MKKKNKKKKKSMRFSVKFILITGSSIIIFAISIYGILMLSQL